MLNYRLNRKHDVKKPKEPLEEEREEKKKQDIMCFL